MRAENDFTNKSAEIALWSAPLIADRVHDGYERLFGGANEFSETLSWLHRRLWQTLLEGDAPQAERARSDLMSVARLASLPAQEIEAIDAVIVDDLLRVILRHGASSRETARCCGMRLVQAASKLGEMRAAA